VSVYSIGITSFHSFMRLGTRDVDVSTMFFFIFGAEGGLPSVSDPMGPNLKIAAIHQTGIPVRSCQADSDPV